MVSRRIGVLAGRSFGSLLIVAAFALLGVAPALGVTQSLPISVCDVLDELDKYDGKAIELRAVVVSGFEVSALRDDREICDGSLWLAYAGGGPQAFTSLQSRTPVNVRPAPPLVRDIEFEEFQRLLRAEMHPRDRGSICVSCNRYRVTATMRGRIDVASDGTGFGHFNGYRARFVLAQVIATSATDLSGNYDPEMWSPTPVRFPAGYLTGHVVRQDGWSVDSILVTALRVEDVPPYLQRFSERTDEEGRFEIEVPPGTYVVGVNVTSPPTPKLPFETSYSPGTTVKEQADSFALADEETVELSIQLATRLIQRKVAVKVVWPDGTPVENADVWLVEESNPYHIVEPKPGVTDSEGRQVLAGFDGRSYLARAAISVRPFLPRNCGQRRTGQLTAKTSEEVTIILTGSSDACLGW